jgi:hypothetical protein
VKGSELLDRHSYCLFRSAKFLSWLLQICKGHFENLCLLCGVVVAAPSDRFCRFLFSWDVSRLSSYRRPVKQGAEEDIWTEEG